MNILSFGRTRGLRLALLVTVVAGASACSQSASPPDGLDPAEVNELFATVHYDYEPVVTGDELAQFADTVVTAELSSISVGPSSPDHNGDPVPGSNVLLSFQVTEVLTGSSEQEITVLMPGTPETSEVLGGAELVAASGSFLLYLEQYVEDPTLPLTGDIPDELYIPVGPQGMYMALDETTTAVTLDQGSAIDAELADFVPSDEPLPVLADH